MKEAKLTKVEKALLLLAEHIDRCPYNDYPVQVEVADVLGYEKVKAKRPLQANH